MLDQTVIDQSIPIPSAALRSDPPPVITNATRNKRDRDARSDVEHSTPAKRTKANLPLAVGAGFVDSETSKNAMGAFLAKYAFSLAAGNVD